MAAFGIVVLSPSFFRGALQNPALAIAAARAGARGVLDLEFMEDSVDLAAVHRKLIRHAPGGAFGIRVAAGKVRAAIEAIKFNEVENEVQPWLIIYAGDESFTAERIHLDVQHARKAGLFVALEAVCVEEAIIAQEAGVDAVIAKGHESLGRVGDTTTFVLVQQCVKQLAIPVWAQGGIGPHTAAAVRAAGGAGVVLDSQVYLARDSHVPEELQFRLARIDGTETTLLRGPEQEFYRVLSRTGSAALEKLTHDLENVESQGKEAWRRTVGIAMKDLCKDNDFEVLPVGQDASLAANLAKFGGTVAGIISLVEDSVASHIEQAAGLTCLKEGGPLAASHGTRYPIVQGAMTRVSDNADFALKVAEGGALPFLALALMRKNEIESLLAETSKKLGSLPWGVGILGFVPQQLRAEQLEVVNKYKPPFALIAGGRPDQAKALEDAGTRSYLHVPSPLLLQSFVEMGSRRFIFEGKECGGHVGPRSSFILWEQMIEVLLASIGPREDASLYHVLFAGGIHDELSAAMVAAMAAPLSARGVRVGVLLGTAYLFTEEAVSTGAIVPRFQQEAIKCNKTVLLETGPGHAIRCIDSPYKDLFDEKRKELQHKRHSRDDIREELEMMNLGRLRIASKGIARDGSNLVSVEEERQWSEGMYMIGQVASLHDKAVTIQSLHENVSRGSCERLLTLRPETQIEATFADSTKQPKGEPVAIVGMACFLPEANDLETYWQNILNKVDAVTEIPLSHWDWRNYYDPNPLAQDKIVSKWGGFLKEIVFDPGRYGIPPSSLASIDPMQLFLLEAVRTALNDAGYANRRFPRQKASVVLANAGHGPITAFYSLRSMMGWSLDFLDDEIKQRIIEEMPHWTEDSFPGYLGNVAAGRVANRFDLGGLNFCVDAACASSLAALYVGMRDLQSGDSDVVILGAADTHNQPGDYLSFSKTHALSGGGRCRTFDATADGIVISEGLAVVVLKRLSDAERDGDRIYAVVRGIGGSSDGRDLSLTAPRPAGQMLALRRAYENAGVSPSTVSLVEAHGTGTVAGDKAEVEALSKVFTEAGAAKNSCAIGSVKTNIGHTKCTAGLVSLIKVAKALHHKVLPPTIGVQEPNPACNFGNNPFYINSERRPWLHTDEQIPRRAGVSAFGFGGTNFHTVLEEYVPPVKEENNFATQTWPGELFSFRATTIEELTKALTAAEESVRKVLKEKNTVFESDVTSADGRRLFELARTVYTRYCDQKGEEGYSAAIVATSLEDLQEKLAQAKTMLSEDVRGIKKDPRGIYVAKRDSSAKVAWLFPGQGSQRVNMLADIALYFPEIRETFEYADKVLAQSYEKPLSKFVYPEPVFSDSEREQQQSALTSTEVAQPAVGTADVGVAKLFRSFGLAPDMVAGHSYGEYVALHEAGVFTTEQLLKISSGRGKLLGDTSVTGKGAMAAVAAEAGDVTALLRDLPGVTLANINAPKQCIVSGTVESIDAAVSTLNERGIASRKIPVSAAFHSPMMTHAVVPLKNLLEFDHTEPTVPVYANSTAQPYPRGKEEIANMLSQHVVQPVRFADEIKAMYDAGARVFVEVGPGSVLTGLVEATLGTGNYLAVSVERNGKHGLLQLLHALAQLLVSGVSINVARLYRSRGPILAESSHESGVPTKTKLLYRVHSAKIERITAGAPANTAAATAKAEPVSATKKAPQPNVNGHHGQTGNGKVTPTALSNMSSTNQKTADPSSTDSRVVRPQPKPQQAPVVANRQPVRAAGVDKVVLEFQQTMLEMTNRFIEAQQTVMLAYLQGVSTPGNQSAPGGVTAAPTYVAADVSEVISRLSNAGGGAPQNGQSEAEYYIDHNGNHPESRENVTEVVAANLSPQRAESNGASGDTELNSEELIESLLEIVSERTGYPVQMLDPSLDLEADLGIDSIKRVEILNSFRKLLPESTQSNLEGNLEQLAGTKTLQAIMDWIRSLNTQAAVKAVVAEPQAQPTVKQEVSRGVLELVEADSTEERSIDGYVLVVPEDKGIAAQLKQVLTTRAVTTVVVDSDASDPEQLRSRIASVKAERGEPGAVVYLAGLKAKASKPAEAALGLLALAKEMEPYWKSQGQRRPRFLAVTRMDGNLGSTGSVTNFEYLTKNASVAGLTKTIAKELLGASVRYLDLETEVDVERDSQLIVRELFAADEELEVTGGTERKVPQIFEARVESRSDGAPLIDATSLVLITGGARGITAEIAIALAEKYRPNLVLVGRAPRPSEPESATTAGLTSAKEIKAALIEELRLAGKPISVPAVEQTFQKLMRDREIRSTIEQLEKKASSVRYYSLDVRDESAFAEFIDSVYESYGNIDGVIHGAGVIEDAYIKDKTYESYERVFDTKVRSAHVLARKLRLDSLKFAYFFSSIVGRTGNAGQGDYVAANEALNKLAVYLDKRSPARIASLNWGPWRAGMAQPELEEVFHRYGWAMIERDAGRASFIAELEKGQKGETEILLVGKPDKPTDTPSGTNNGHELAEVRVSGGPAVPVLAYCPPGDEPGSFLVNLAVKDHLYLEDHKFDGIPVMPMAMAMEMMLEAAQITFPNRRITKVHTLDIPAGIILDSPQKQLVVSVTPTGHANQVTVTVDSVLAASRIQPQSPALASSKKRHFKCVVEFESDYSLNGSVKTALGSIIPVRFSSDGIVAPEVSPPRPSWVYNNWLFHGPIFQGMHTIDVLGQNGVVGRTLASDTAKCLARPGASEWIIDPILFDSSMQLAGVWGRQYLDITCLPTGFQKLHLFGPCPRREASVRIFMPENTRGLELVCDMAIYDELGELKILVENLGGIGSKSFNRFAGQPKTAEPVR